MLTATDLVFRASGRVLIDHFSACFEPGRLHIIMGANGAGKSTLIKMLARLLRPAGWELPFSGGGSDGGSGTPTCWRAR